jgi:hypothetical protein
MVKSNEDSIQKAGFFKKIKRIKRVLKYLLPAKLAKTSAGSTTAPLVSISSERDSVFWKGSISGAFRKDTQELVIYFYVSRSASRAQTFKQEIAAEGGSAEVLRLVSWDYNNPCVSLEVSAVGPETWECMQIKTEGIREPFGYVVLSSSYVKGLVNSLTIVRRELYQHPMRFQVDENSNCTRLPDGDRY